MLGFLPGDRVQMCTSETWWQPGEVGTISTCGKQVVFRRATDREQPYRRSWFFCEGDCTLIDFDHGDPGPFKVDDRVRCLDIDGPVDTILGVVDTVDAGDLFPYHVTYDSGDMRWHRESELAKISAKRYPPPYPPPVASFPDEAPTDKTPAPPSPKPLTSLGKASNANARAKGFYDELIFARGFLRAEVKLEGYSAYMQAQARVLAFVEQLWIGMRLSLIHSEVSEMLEALRDADMDLRVNEKGKPEGFDSEAADVIIRLTDLVAGMGGDLDKAVELKAAYNATRPALHSRKAGL